MGCVPFYTGVGGQMGLVSCGGVKTAPLETILMRDDEEECHSLAKGDTIMPKVELPMSFLMTLQEDASLRFQFEQDRESVLKAQGFSVREIQPLLALDLNEYFAGREVVFLNK
jgi:hypothetical protein